MTQRIVYEVGGREIVLGLPEEADESEVAAISAAISATIRDREGEEKDEEREIDPWKMSGRLNISTDSRVPKSLRKTNGWRLSSRRDRF
ncbi:MAG: acc operon protein [Halobacteria archaeon]|nr:acc operon protein [Halobacteria archaeon]